MGRPIDWKAIREALNSFSFCATQIAGRRVQRDELNRRRAYKVLLLRSSHWHLFATDQEAKYHIDSDSIILLLTVIERTIKSCFSLLQAFKLLLSTYQLSKVCISILKRLPISFAIQVGTHSLCSCWCLICFLSIQPTIRLSTYQLCCLTK